VRRHIDVDSCGGEGEDGDGVGEHDCHVGGQANDPRGAQPTNC